MSYRNLRREYEIQERYRNLVDVLEHLFEQELDSDGRRVALALLKQLVKDMTLDTLAYSGAFTAEYRKGKKLLQVLRLSLDPAKTERFQQARAEALRKSKPATKDSQP